MSSTPPTTPPPPPPPPREEPKKRSKKAKDEILKLALKRFKQSSEAWQKQREREKEVLRFQVPELQWDDDAKRARKGEIIAGVPVPPRPMLSVDLLYQPIQLVENQERAAHLGINVHPLSPDASDDTAEIIQGRIRHEDRSCNASQARSWAFARAARCGLGWYRIHTKFDDAGGHPFDQVITVERILHQDAVYIDPAAQKPDFSDARYGFMVEWVNLDDFKRDFPKASISKAESLEFADLVKEAPEWVRQDGDTAAVLVAEYWYKEYEDETYVALKDGRAVPEDELTDEDEIDESIAKRVKQECVVQWCKLTGSEILDEEELNGHYIPLIPVLWRELQPFDKGRWWMGIIEPAMDGQRGFNYSVSQAIEIAALEPKAPFIGAEGSFEGHEAEWQQANLRNFPFLEYKATTVPGSQTPNPPPMRTPIDASRLTVSMQLAQQFRDAVQSTTQTFDPSLGMRSPKEQSGKAILGLQGQSDQANSHGLANMADISMAYEALVRLDLIPAIYDRKGRMVQILDDEDESDSVMLNQPHIINPQTQQPQPIMLGPDGKPTVPIPPAGPGPGAAPPEVRHYDLRKGVYGVDVTIGKSWQSRLEQGSEEIGQILQADPQLMPIIGPLYFKFRDFPGAKEIADLLKKVRAKQFPGLDDDEKGQPSPGAAAAQLQAAKQQIQQLQQQLQQADMALKTDQAKQQATIQKTQMETASREKIATEKNTIELIMNKLDNMQKTLDTAMITHHEKDMQGSEMAHDVGMAGAEAIHAAHAQALAPPAPPEGEAPFTAADPLSLGGEGGI